MNVTLSPSRLSGSIQAIASKSVAQRLLLCAALSDRPTEIVCESLSRDIEATAGSLKQLGSDIHYDRGGGVFHVTPIIPGSGPCMPDVGESGATLRFLLPVICALGSKAHITMHGRLPERPLSPLWEELEHHGCRLVRRPDGSIDTEGQLRGGDFRIDANVSSQFISGLLFALPLLEEESRIRLSGPVESEGYILLTIRALERFGIAVIRDGDCLRLAQGNTAAYLSPGRIRVEGDWSCGALWEVADMLQGGAADGLICTGLDEASAQGDRAVQWLKKEIAGGNAVIDARNVPDLVPVLSVLAAVSPGTTVFTHANRLRLKESDRIRSVIGMLRALGGSVEETADGLVVRGQETLRGGYVDSCGDHRIAMSAAIASLVCRDKVVLTGAEAVEKSYPSFWRDFEKLGGQIRLETT